MTLDERIKGTDLLNQIERAFGDVEATPETQAKWDETYTLIKELKWFLRDTRHLDLLEYVSADALQRELDRLSSRDPRFVRSKVARSVFEAISMWLIEERIPPVEKE